MSTNKELPDELEEAMNEAVQNLLDDGEIGAMIAESGVSGWYAENFEYSSVEEQDGGFRVEGPAVFAVLSGEPDPESDKPFKGDKITASVVMSCRRNSDGEWEVSVEEVSDCEINTPY